MNGKQYFFLVAILVLGMSLFGPVPSVVGGSKLPPEVETAFSAAGVPNEAIAIVVEKLDQPHSGRRLVSHNP
ncbi:MAG: hypothetical protein Q8J76_15375, partial [Desulfobulbaceae bacterium]|nr:hypothetical protein [Desulfobulbaceae bacterium]